MFAFVVAALCIFLPSQLQAVQHVIDVGDPIGCDLLPAYDILSCYSNKNDSVLALKNALNQTTNWDEVHLILNNYAVDQLPLDIFDNVKLTYFSINANCTSNGIPKNLLQSVQSPLAYLELVNVDRIETIAPVDTSNFPFSHNLITLNLQLSDLTTVDDGSFQEFDQLKTLTIAQSKLNQLSSGILNGLNNLQELSIVLSSISTLPLNLFASTPQLKSLWLDQNNIQNLPSGSTDGLNQLQLISLVGNPFYCDCSLQWFKDWLINRSLLETSGATCAYPINAPFEDVDFCNTVA